MESNLFGMWYSGLSDLVVHCIRTLRQVRSQYPLLFSWNVVIWFSYLIVEADQCLAQSNAVCEKC